MAALRRHRKKELSRPFSNFSEHPLEYSAVNAWVSALSMAVACAVLSVFVVSRRWAFIGEGISHAGFGGAGTAWVAALIFPALDRLPWVPYAGVILFCLATAGALGYFTRANRVNSDAAIGIFLVASLAWGFLAQYIYRSVRHVDPLGFDTFLFGQLGAVTPHFAVAAALLCAAIVAVVFLLGKEIIFYCFDPAMAEASGVHVGFIHYLLMLLVSLTIVIAARVVGSVLATALLVLPGAAALLLSPRLRDAMALAIVVALAGTIAGLGAHFAWGLPAGPLIVLALFAEFLLAYAARRITRPDDA